MDDGIDIFLGCLGFFCGNKGTFLTSEEQETFQKDKTTDEIVISDTALLEVIFIFH